jgi:hypothetical protein
MAIATIQAAASGTWNEERLTAITHYEPPGDREQKRPPRARGAHTAAAEDTKVIQSGRSFRLIVEPQTVALRTLGWEISGR